MANSILHAGIPIPLFGCKYTVVIPYLDADGDPVDPTSPDTEKSVDGATFSDCVNEVTTIAGSNGVGYVTLTASEMQANVLTIAAKSANAKTTILTLNPYQKVQVGAGPYTPVASSSGSITMNLADVINAFGRTDIRIEGMWVQVQHASSTEDIEAR